MPASTSQVGRRPNPATRQRWHERLERFGRSGLSVAAFCDGERISTASFYAWRRRLRHDPLLPTSDTPRFIPVTLVSPSARASVELLLPSGIMVRLPPDTDFTWLRSLLELLGCAPC